MLMFHRDNSLTSWAPTILGMLGLGWFLLFRASSWLPHLFLAMLDAALFIGLTCGTSGWIDAGPSKTLPITAWAAIVVVHVGVGVHAIFGKAFR